MTVYKQLAH